jgi:hypothetical protein
MKSVRIPSIWAEGSSVAEFKLGLGPCGKVVTSLNGYWSADGRVYTVQQRCEDEEVKCFHYPLHTITGRIVETN